MNLETIAKHKGELFSGEFKEQTTCELRRFGGVLTEITGSMLTFEGRYKTFCLDFKSIVTFSCRTVDADSDLNGKNTDSKK